MFLRKLCCKLRGPVVEAVSCLPYLVHIPVSNTYIPFSANVFNTFEACSIHS